ncbi:MAG TPA: M56 family metallopeptidase [Jatrophihabitans sp.]|nr:M56 family metallopeptidase [Jatrophihabitans sp.]
MTHLVVYLPLVLAGLFGSLAPGAARRLPPRIATWLLSGGAVLAATAAGTSLALLAFTLLAMDPEVAEQGGWSQAALRQNDPVAVPVAAVALAGLTVLVACALRVAVRRIRALRQAYRLAAGMRERAGELVVVPSGEREAFALPGRPGRIVITSTTLRSLDAAQRKALLAHERAHLVHRHHLHQAVVTVAAALNPLLFRLPAATRLSCERWADEDAADGAGRSAVAEALLRLGLGGHSEPMPGALAARGADVATRVQALRRPAIRLRVWRAALPVGVVVTALAASAVAVDQIHTLLELAQAATQAALR